MGKVLDILKRREVAQSQAEALSDDGERPSTGRGKPANTKDGVRASSPAPGGNGDAPQGQHAETAPGEDIIPFFEYPEEPAARPVTKECPSPAPPPAPAAMTYEPGTQPVPRTPATIGKDLVVWREPRSALADQYRRLCAAMTPQLTAGQVQVLLLPALEVNLRATIAVANLALALAEQRQRPLLLIDADPQGGQMALLFGLAAAPGWTELMAGMPLPQVVQESGWPRLHVIAAGNRLASARPALRGEQLAGLWPQLRQQYELVLVSPPAWHGSTAPAVLAHYCDATCLLISKTHAGQPLERTCLDALQREGIRFLGSILLTG
jgi:Mrp family chromosome partitioning ATPase